MRKVISIASIKTQKTKTFTWDIIPPKKQAKIKGGANPWLELS